MKVKLLIGLRRGKVYAPGDIYETEDEAEARRLISGRWALPYEPDQIERAVKPAAPERRSSRRPGKRGPEQ